MRAAAAHDPVATLAVAPQIEPTQTERSHEGASRLWLLPARLTRRWLLLGYPTVGCDWDQTDGNHAAPG
jgi:hypothetical protein